MVTKYEVFSWYQEAELCVNLHNFYNVNLKIVIPIINPIAIVQSQNNFLSKSFLKTL